MNIFRYAVLSICSIALGCTGVTSVGLHDREHSNSGLVYFLPTTRIPLAVAIDHTNGQLKVIAGDPIYIADERHPYRLTSLYSPASAEIIEFKINANGLLTTANLKSDGRLDEAIVEAAKSAGLFFESSVQRVGEQQVYATLIDVEELTQRDDAKECKKTLKVKELAEGVDVRGCKQLKLNDEIISALTKAFAPLKFEEKQDSAGSQFLKQAKEAKLPLEITVERLFQDSQSQTHDQQKAHDNCAVGICYRLPVNYLFTASFFDGTVNRVTFAVPNGSRTYATAINRGLFTTWDTKVALDNGMLESYMMTTEGSELEEFAKLPTEVVGGLIEGITQKGKLFDAQSTRIASELKLLEEREKLKKAREDKLKPESSVSDRSFFTLLAGPPAPTRMDRPVQPGPDPSKAGSGGRVSSGNPGTAEGGLIPKAK